MKLGDCVNYSGELSGEPPCKNCIIEEIEDSNVIFNQPMATITKIDCWVAIAELSLCCEEEQ